MCSQCDVETFLENVQAMINDDDHRYVWAFDTLDGIRETVSRTGHVTPKQSMAVSNIEEVGRHRRAK